MTDKKKQIEEMANVLERSFDEDYESGFEPCSTFAAVALYDAGYRKQVEGEWKDSDRNGVSIKGYMACSACDVMVPTVADGRYCLPRLRYCPNCGAKMVEEKTLEIKSERRDLTFGTGEPAVSHEKAVETVKGYVRLMEIAEMSKVACSSCD